jgi:hypothetical protein
LNTINDIYSKTKSPSNAQFNNKLTFGAQKDIDISFNPPKIGQRDDISEIFDTKSMFGAISTLQIQRMRKMSACPSMNDEIRQINEQLLDLTKNYDVKDQEYSGSPEEKMNQLLNIIE